VTGHAAEQEHGGRWGYLGAGWDAAAGTSTRELWDLRKEGWGPRGREAVPGAYGRGPLGGALAVVVEFGFKLLGERLGGAGAMIDGLGELGLGAAERECEREEGGK